VILALDTSTLLASVAVLDGDGRLRAARRARVTTHSEMLLALVEGALVDAGCDPRGRDLRAVACGAGPGSFTGLRIGLATAKGLCLALGLPLAMVSSLRALAARAPGEALAVGCIDAFKGEVYAGLFRGRDADGAPRPECDEMVLAPERLAALLAERVAAGPVRLVGEVVARWPVLAVPGVDTSDPAPPDAAEVGRLAAPRLARGEHDDLAAAVPSYVRASEAELLRGRREGE
jgi:tRNA threonylcarbamoyladenosine biosynthesis protein TsaB